MSAEPVLFYDAGFEKALRAQAVPAMLNLFGESHSHAYTKELSAPWLLPVWIGFYHRLLPSGRSPKSDYCVFERLPADVVELVNANPRGRLLLDLSWEMAFCREEVIVGMHEAIERCGLRPERVSLLNANLVSTDAYARVAARLQVQTPINMIGANTIYWYCAGTLFYRHAAEHGLRAWVDRTQRETVLGGRRRPRRFLSLNRHARYHRLLLMMHLVLEGAMDRGVISFVANPGDVKWSTEELARDFARMFPDHYPRDAARAAAAVCEMLPLTLDLPPGGRSANRVFDQPADAAFYEDTYFSLVTDTCFFDPDTMFITEKVLKSIFRLHPFLYVGNAGALCELRKLGFRTFAPLIDETYDEIGDHPARLAAVVRELRRLCDLSDDDMHALYVELWPILQHNYRVMCELGRERCRHAMREIWARCSAA